MVRFDQIRRDASSVVPLNSSDSAMVTPPLDPNYLSTDVVLPSSYLDSIATAIYLASNISTIDKNHHRILSDYNQDYNYTDFNNLKKFDISLDTTITWQKNFSLNQFPTGNGFVDSLHTLYGLQIISSSPYKAHHD